MSTTERAFANLANIGPSAAEQARIDEVNRTIARTMAEVVATRSYNPNQLTPNFTVTPSGAGEAKVPGTWEGPGRQRRDGQNPNRSRRLKANRPMSTSGASPITSRRMLPQAHCARRGPKGRREWRC
jgi:hypothetical protein